MKLSFLPIMAAGVALLSSLVSCENTKPDAAKLDFYYREAERSAQVKIDALSQQRASGEITQAEYDTKVAKIQDNVARRANDMAWTRHELAESQKRALGIPTGDLPVSVGVPTLGGVDSLYRRPGDPLGNSAGPASGPALGSQHGYTPGNRTSF